MIAFSTTLVILGIGAAVTFNMGIFFISAMFLISIVAIFLSKFTQTYVVPASKQAYVRSKNEGQKCLTTVSDKKFNLDLIGDAIKGVGEFVGCNYADNERFVAYGLRNKLGIQSTKLIDKSRQILK